MNTDIAIPTNRSDHAGHKSGLESRSTDSSPIDTQCCSESELIPVGQIPNTVACEIELSENELDAWLDSLDRLENALPHESNRVKFTLEKPELWKVFHSVTNEMICSKAGR